MVPRKTLKLQFVVPLTTCSALLRLLGTTSIYGEHKFRKCHLIALGQVRWPQRRQTCKLIWSWIKSPPEIISTHYLCSPGIPSLPSTPHTMLDKCGTRQTATNQVRLGKKRYWNIICRFFFGSAICHRQHERTTSTLNQITNLSYLHWRGK